KAIDSVLAQDFTNFELIVSDDGSTDNTPEIISSYGNKIKAIYRENKGVSAARNRGIAIASGEFFAFLDSDDLWLTEKISSQIDFFNSNNKALICQTEEIWIRNGTKVNPMKKHRKKSGMIFEPSLLLCLISPSAVMIKRELFDIAGLFDETLPACEDYDLWLRITCKFPVFLIDKPLIIKKGGHEDQLSKMPCLDRYRIKSIEKILKNGHLTEKQFLAASKVLKKKCRIYANGCIKRGRETEAGYYMELIDRFG
ncbi:glycosyltransferase, partial [Desulfobacterales bacterium HSG17]|nr:glycosyltransferase [Desulfobacterales bacterium HSG17]